MGRGGRERDREKTWVSRYQRIQASPVRGTQGVRQESANIYSNAFSVGEVRGILGRAEFGGLDSSPEVAGGRDRGQHEIMRPASLYDASC